MRYAYSRAMPLISRPLGLTYDVDDVTQLDEFGNQSLREQSLSICIIIQTQSFIDSRLAHRSGLFRGTTGCGCGTSLT